MTVIADFNELINFELLKISYTSHMQLIIFWQLITLTPMGFLPTDQDIINNLRSQIYSIITKQIKNREFLIAKLQDKNLAVILSIEDDEISFIFTNQIGYVKEIFAISFCEFGPNLPYELTLTIYNLLTKTNPDNVFISTYMDRKNRMFDESLYNGLVLTLNRLSSMKNGPNFFFRSFVDKTEDLKVIYPWNIISIRDSLQYFKLNSKLDIPFRIDQFSTIIFNLSLYDIDFSLVLKKYLYMAFGNNCESVYDFLSNFDFVSLLIDFDLGLSLSIANYYVQRANNTMTEEFDEEEMWYIENDKMVFYDFIYTKESLTTKDKLVTNSFEISEEVYNDCIRIQSLINNTNEKNLESILLTMSAIIKKPLSKVLITRILKREFCAMKILLIEFAKGISVIDRSDKNWFLAYDYSKDYLQVGDLVNEFFIKNVCAKIQNGLFKCRNKMSFSNLLMILYLELTDYLKNIEEPCEIITDFFNLENNKKKLQSICGNTIKENSVGIEILHFSNIFEEVTCSFATIMESETDFLDYAFNLIIPVCEKITEYKYLLTKEKKELIKFRTFYDELEKISKEDRQFNKINPKFN